MNVLIMGIYFRNLCDIKHGWSLKAAILGNAVRSKGNVIKRTPTWSGPCFWSCFGTITRRWPTYQATWWEEAWAVFRDIGWVCGDGVVGRGWPCSDWCHAPAVSWLQFHTLGQGHLVLYALFILLPPGAAGAGGRYARIRGYVFGRGRGKREEVWTGVTGRQGGGGWGWGVDGQAGRGAMVQVLGKGAQVPRRSAVVRGDSFAPLQPGQRAVQ